MIGVLHMQKQMKRVGRGFLKFRLGKVKPASLVVSRVN